METISDDVKVKRNIRVDPWRAKISELYHANDEKGYVLNPYQVLEEVLVVGSNETVNLPSICDINWVISSLKRPQAKRSSTENDTTDDFDE